MMGEKKPPISLEYIQHNWELFARSDPMWAILTDPKFKGKKWDRAQFFETGQSDVDGIVKRIAELIPDSDATTFHAVDFGCGMGRLTQALSARCRSATGVDISAEMIRLGNEAAKEITNCAFIHDRTASLERIADDSFDLLITLITMQHIPTDHGYRYIESFLRIVRRGGILVIDLPIGNDKSIRGFIFRYAPRWLLRLYRRVAHKVAIMDLFPYSPSALGLLFEKHNVEVLAADVSTLTGSGWVGRRYYLRMPL